MQCSSIRRIVAIALAASLWAAAALAQNESAADRRVALVIGNGAYRNVAPLANPGNDARLIAETLNQLGFQLVGGKALLDADRPTMEQAIRDFGQSLRGGAVGLFYYSGHGIQMRGHNYLIPVTATVQQDTDVKYELIDLGLVLDEMTDAGDRLNIVVLDACRNNPFGGGGTRAVTSGLGQMTAPAGTVIGYATQPDSVAADGSGRNSPYTGALAAAFRRPGLDLFATFNEVGLQVKQATGGRQQPWLSASPIEGQFYFAGLAKDQPATSAADPDAVFWDMIKASDNSSDFVEYLARFPEGQFAGLARRRLLAECEALAASPNADPPRLIAACRAAPSSARSDYLLGRAFEAAGQHGQAADAYRAAADEGSTAADAALGALYETGRGVPQDDAEAARRYRRAAEQGVPTAQAAIGAAFHVGRGVPQDDGEAVRWWRRAAEQGDPAGETALAAMYSAGRIVRQDDAEAVRWWHKAAEQGDPAAESKLAEAYAEGKGVPRDRSEAVRWYRKAAEQGDAGAQYNLGWMYQFGLGVDPDKAEAARWYRRAAEQGNERAKSALGRL
jgi:TPR repeat protein